jgi:anti-anti-sigma regulatory factor
MSTWADLHAAVEATDAGWLVFDLTDASFIDSTIIREIVGAAGQRQVVVAAPNEEDPRRVLGVAGIDHVVDLVETREEALWMVEDA